MNTKEVEKDVRTYVRERYDRIASEAKTGDAASCCPPQSSGCCSPGGGEQATQGNASQLYDVDVRDLPQEVTDLSLGCGDPVTLASLQPGQTVVDLGSGGGIDCFLAAKQVAPTGHVIGVDMTPAMLDQARANKAQMGVENVEFRLGEIEHMPVADESADVVISNCVINLSPDKPQVFREAYRVLKPGGRLVVSDIVTDGPLPEQIKSSLSAWAGCVAGALDVKDYLAAIEQAGFVDVKLEPVPVPIDEEVAVQVMDQYGSQIDLEAVTEEQIKKTVFSAKVTAYKPEA